MKAFTITCMLSYLLLPFWWIIGSILGSDWVPKVNQDLLFLGANFGSLFLGFGGLGVSRTSFLWPPVVFFRRHSGSKNHQMLWVLYGFWKCRFFALCSFWWALWGHLAFFWGVLVPKWGPNGFQNWSRKWLRSWPKNDHKNKEKNVKFGLKTWGYHEQKSLWPKCLGPWVRLKICIFEEISRWLQKCLGFLENGRKKDSSLVHDCFKFLGVVPTTCLPGFNQPRIDACSFKSRSDCRAAALRCFRLWGSLGLAGLIVLLDCE